MVVHLDHIQFKFKHKGHWVKVTCHKIAHTVSPNHLGQI